MSLVKELKKLKGIKLECIFTHFPVAGNSESDLKEHSLFTRKQIKNFSDFVYKLRDDGISFSLVHAANSAAVIFYKESFFNLVRPGLLVYGLYPGKFNINLKLNSGQIVSPVMSLLSRVTNLRVLQKGAGISYGHTYLTERKERIATISTGYGDGYSFRLSNRCEVLIHGKRAPIRGRVCMDLTMVSVSHIPDVKVGDKVVLF